MSAVVRRTRIRRGAFYAIVMCMLSLTLSCAESQDRQTATPTSVDLRSLLVESTATLRSQIGFHFELEDASQTTLVLPGIIFLKAEGDSVGKDRARVEMGVKPTDVTAFLDMEVRVMGDLAYVKDPINGQWRGVDAVVLPVNFVDLGDTLARLLLKMESLQYVGRVTGKGRSWHHISGILSPRDFGILFYAVARNGTTAVDVHIDTESLLPFEVSVRGPILETDRDDAQRTLRLSRFGRTVEVTPP